MRRALHLRQALIPYIYTAARQAYDTGISILRPMYYDNAEVTAAYEAADQYMFGDDILVAPVATKMDPRYALAPRSVWLPEGDWIEWFTGAWMRGPGRFERMFSLDEIPVYVRAGAIIPMQLSNNKAGEPIDTLILKIFPGQSGSTKLYEDSGDSLGYQRDEFAWTEISTSNTGLNVTVAVAAAHGSYPGMPHERGYRLEFVQTFPPESVTVNGHAAPRVAHGDAGMGWYYDGAAVTTVVTLPPYDVRQQLTIDMDVRAEHVIERDLLAGAAGMFARLRRAMDIINSEAYPEWSPDSLIEAVQTSRRISLQPETALPELRRFWTEHENVLRDIQNLDADATVIKRAIVQVTSVRVEDRAEAATAK
jgi:alpha-glucosidase